VRSGEGWVVATFIGVAIGAVYVLSPLTVWFALAMWALHRYLVSGLDADERRWLTLIVIVAVLLRVAAVAGLFALTDHARTPFGFFVGDEEFYLRRAVWLRNVALGVPIHSADLIYAFDDSGWTSHLYVLAFVQVLVGPSPYGVHLVGIGFYLFAAFMLFRLVRPAFGRAPAILTLQILLFLPSFFAWSISALKEPLYFLMTVAALSFAVTLVRHPSWLLKIVAAVGLVALVAGLETVRDAGGILTGAGIAFGFLLAWIICRPRVIVAIVVAVPILTGAVLRSPQRQFDAYVLVSKAARQHWGHVATPGWVYTLVDERFYPDISVLSDMHFHDQAQFVVRAFERYVTVPWPWEVKSPSALAYLPEQVIWYFIVALLPAGLLFSWRRDPLRASLLLSVAAVAMTAIALLNGNVGTLVRLRILSIPYFASLSMVGLCELLRLPLRSQTRNSHSFEKAEPLWQ
jgi:hypothetical protein